MPYCLQWLSNCEKLFFKDCLLPTQKKEKNNVNQTKNVNIIYIENLFLRKVLLCNNFHKALKQQIQVADP